MTDNDLRAALAAIPVGIRPGPGLSSVAGWSRYDTDDEHVLHVWVNDQKERGVSFDLRTPRAAFAAPTPSLDVERLWSVLSGFGVIENGTWVSFQREDAEKIAAEYAAGGPR